MAAFDVYTLTTLPRNKLTLSVREQANDDEVVATSSNMSLKDPVQMTRIETPCRSMACKHNECFDAAVYLALQEQAPTWTCPICSKPAPWDQLVFDQFFQDILNSTDDVEQVTIEPNGEWHRVKEVADSQQSKSDNKQSQDDDDDDDLIEITEIDNSAFAAPPTQLSPEATDNLPSRKRPREEVIDLTLSDDDDELPISRIKRPSLASPTDMSRPTLPAPSFRFNLPPPVPRLGTNSPSNNGYGSSSYDYDRHMTTRL